MTGFYSIFIQIFGWVFIAMIIACFIVWLSWIADKTNQLPDDNYDKDRALALPAKFIAAVDLFVTGISNQDKKIKVLVDLFKVLMEIINVGVNPEECRSLASEFDRLLNSDQFLNWLNSDYIDNYSTYIILSGLNEYLGDYITLVNELSKKAKP